LKAEPWLARWACVTGVLARTEIESADQRKDAAISCGIECHQVRPPTAGSCAEPGRVYARGGGGGGGQWGCQGVSGGGGATSPVPWPRRPPTWAKAPLRPSSPGVEDSIAPTAKRIPRSSVTSAPVRSRGARGLAVASTTGHNRRHEAACGFGYSANAAVITPSRPFELLPAPSCATGPREPWPARDRIQGSCLFALDFGPRSVVRCLLLVACRWSLYTVSGRPRSRSDFRPRAAAASRRASSRRRMAHATSMIGAVHAVREIGPRGRAASCAAWSISMLELEHHAAAARTRAGLCARVRWAFRHRSCPSTGPAGRQRAVRASARLRSCTRLSKLDLGCGADARRPAR
jgi:hypothetical protein